MDESRKFITENYSTSLKWKLRYAINYRSKQMKLLDWVNWNGYKSTQTTPVDHNNQVTQTWSFRKISRTELSWNHKNNTHHSHLFFIFFSFLSCDRRFLLQESTLVKRIIRNTQRAMLRNKIKTESYLSSWVIFIQQQQFWTDLRKKRKTQLLILYCWTKHENNREEKKSISINDWPLWRRQRRQNRMQ